MGIVQFDQDRKINEIFCLASVIESDLPAELPLIGRKDGILVDCVVVIARYRRSLLVTQKNEWLILDLCGVVFQFGRSAPG